MVSPEGIAFREKNGMFKGLDIEMRWLCSREKRGMCKQNIAQGAGVRWVTEVNRNQAVHT